MAINKQAFLRYQALDRCFSNPGRRFYIDDLVEACNEAIYEATESEAGVKRRQVYSDITFMESEAGWSIPLERVADGRRKFFRYTDPSFSIRGRGVNRAELEQISDTLTILSRFRGLPHFEWIDQIQLRLEETFGIRSTAVALVGFEENPYLTGLTFFSKLLQAATNRCVLEVVYQSFNQEVARRLVFHSYFLKQYNNRWFVLGLNETFGQLSTLALDRIQELEESTANFQPNESYDFEEYFEDIVGVSIPEEAVVETVRLQVDASLLPYLRSKPLHGSQKERSYPDGTTVLELQLIVNYEFISLLASFLDRVEVLLPLTLRQRMRDRLTTALSRYS